MGTAGGDPTSPRSRPWPRGGATDGYNPAPTQDMCSGRAGRASPAAAQRALRRPSRARRAASSPRAVCLPLRASTGVGREQRQGPPLLLPPGKCSPA
jgi:hypothetical protein